MIKKDSKKKKVGISSPWYSYCHKVQALFKKDPEVRVEVDDSGTDLKVKLFVENPKKADALTQLMPVEKNVAGVTVYTEVIPANSPKKSMGALFEDAFDGNPVFSEVMVIEGLYNNPITYVIFEDVVAQYYNDNLGDPHGNISTLYQELARDIFEIDSINYCTKLIEE